MLQSREGRGGWRPSQRRPLSWAWKRGSCCVPPFHGAQKPRITTTRLWPHSDTLGTLVGLQASGGRPVSAITAFLPRSPGALIVQLLLGVVVPGQWCRRRGGAPPGASRTHVSQNWFVLCRAPSATLHLNPSSITPPSLEVLPLRLPRVPSPFRPWVFSAAVSHLSLSFPSPGSQALLGCSILFPSLGLSPLVAPGTGAYSRHKLQSGQLCLLSWEAWARAEESRNGLVSLLSLGSPGQPRPASLLFSGFFCSVPITFSCGRLVLSFPSV